jgi:PKD repeat protein
MKTLKTQFALLLLLATTFCISAFISVKPAPQIKVDKKVGFLPLLVKFSCNQESPDEIFLWDFADGSTSLGRIATNLYTKPGIYKVKVVVRSGQEMAVDSVNIEVLANNELVNNMAKQRLAQGE